MVIVVVNNSKWSFGIITFIIIISISILLLVFTNKKSNEPHVLYTVYLDGKSIGNIASRDSFESFINVKEERYEGIYIEIECSKIDYKKYNEFVIKE